MHRQALLRKSNDATREAGTAIERGLPLVFARAAEERFGLQLQVSEVRLKTYKMQELQKNLDQAGLYLLLEGPDGATGGAIVDQSCVCALLEHLTIGRVLGKADGSDRPLTAVDAALAASVFDVLLARCDRVFAEVETPEWAPDHKFGSRVEDCRTLVLSLAANGFSVYDITLSLGSVQQAGRLQLILPNEAVAAIDEFSDEAIEAKAQVFRENVMLAPAELRAVLHRETLPFDQLQALKVGDVLEIPIRALQDMGLEIHQKEEVARAAMGQINGQRAVRLILPEGVVPAENPVPQIEAQPAPEPKPKPDPAPPKQELEPLQIAQTTPPEAQSSATGDENFDDLDLDLDDLAQLP